MAQIVLGALVLGGVGLVCLLSFQAQSPPPAAAVTTTAVVVSSLACTDGPGGTLVDVLNPAGDAVRASLDACGYQQGQQLSVQYSGDDPTQLSLAGTDPIAAVVTSERLLPIGLGIAGLLVAATVAAVLLDSRRAGRPESRTGAERAHQQQDDDDSTETELPALGPAELVEVPVYPAELVEDPAHPAPALDADQGPGTAELPFVAAFGKADWSVESPAASGTMRTGQGSTSVDLVFPFASSLADSLHDELFTHRAVYS